MDTSAFERNVFVNCPFDAKYLPLLRPMLFCVSYLGFNPRIALESLDSGRARMDKIAMLILESKFGIHDISRLKAERKGEYFRLNMPFELGLDVGCRRFRDGKWAGKKVLILEAESYRYQAAISDISGLDIFVHGNDPEEVVRGVRDWLTCEEALHAAGTSLIWSRFLEFMSDNYDALKARGFSDLDIERLRVNELVTAMRRWLCDRGVLAAPAPVS